MVRVYSRDAPIPTMHMFATPHLLDDIRCVGAPFDLHPDRRGTIEVSMNHHTISNNQFNAQDQYDLHFLLYQIRTVCFIPASD